MRSWKEIRSQYSEAISLGQSEQLRQQSPIEYAIVENCGGYLDCEDGEQHIQMAISFMNAHSKTELFEIKDNLLDQIKAEILRIEKLCDASEASVNALYFNKYLSLTKAIHEAEIPGFKKVVREYYAAKSALKAQEYIDAK